MELQGKVIVAGEVRSGESARGGWKVQEFVIETHESYPHKMVFTVFGEERLNRFNIQVGQEVQVFFDIDARSYTDRRGKERWATDIRAYDVRQVDPATIGIQAAQPASAPGVINAPAATDTPAAPQTPVTDLAPFPPASAAPEGDAGDDLPF